MFKSSYTTFHFSNFLKVPNKYLKDKKGTSNEFSNRSTRSHSLHFSYFPHVHSLFNLLYGVMYHYITFEDTSDR